MKLYVIDDLNKAKFNYTQFNSVEDALKEYVKCAGHTGNPLVCLGVTQDIPGREGSIDLVRRYGDKDVRINDYKLLEKGNLSMSSDSALAQAVMEHIVSKLGCKHQLVSNLFPGSEPTIIPIGTGIADSYTLDKVPLPHFGYEPRTCVNELLVEGKGYVPYKKFVPLASNEKMPLTVSGVNMNYMQLNGNVGQMDIKAEDFKRMIENVSREYKVMTAVSLSQGVMTPVILSSHDNYDAALDAMVKEQPVFGSNLGIMHGGKNIINIDRFLKEKGVMDKYELEELLEDFTRFVAVRDSAEFNMFDPAVRDAIGISRQTHMDIIRNFDKLDELYNSHLENGTVSAHNAAQRLARFIQSVDTYEFNDTYDGFSDAVSEFEKTLASGDLDSIITDLEYYTQDEPPENDFDRYEAHALLSLMKNADKYKSFETLDSKIDRAKQGAELSSPAEEPLPEIAPEKE